MYVPVLFCLDYEKIVLFQTKSTNIVGGNYIGTSFEKNVIKFQEEGKSEEEILRTIYTWGTQADIAALSISVRRVKYLSKSTI